MKKLLENKLFWMGWALVVTAFQFTPLLGLISVLIVSGVYGLLRGDKDESVKFYQGMNALFFGECIALLLSLIAYAIKLI